MRRAAAARTSALRNGRRPGARGRRSDGRCPVAKSEPVRSSERSRCANALGGSWSSESTNMSNSPPAAPRRRCAPLPRPPFAWRTSVKRASLLRDPRRDRRRPVGRAVVDRDDLEVGERLRAQRREALLQVGLDAVDGTTTLTRGTALSWQASWSLPTPAAPPASRAAGASSGSRRSRCTGPRSPRSAGFRPSRRPPQTRTIGSSSQRLRARRHRAHDDEPRRRARAPPRGGDISVRRQHEEALLPPPVRRHRLGARRPRRARRPADPRPAPRSRRC